MPRGAEERSRGGVKVVFIWLCGVFIRQRLVLVVWNARGGGVAVLKIRIAYWRICGVMGVMNLPIQP